MFIKHSLAKWLCELILNAVDWNWRAIFCSNDLFILFRFYLSCPNLMERNSYTNDYKPKRRPGEQCAQRNIKDESARRLESDQRKRWRLRKVHLGTLYFGKLGCVTMNCDSNWVRQVAESLDCSCNWPTAIALWVRHARVCLKINHQNAFYISWLF